jgi:hypothetical protein
MAGISGLTFWKCNRSSREVAKIPQEDMKLKGEN